MSRSALGILRKARLPDDQARAILEAMEFERIAHQGALVTKADLRELEYSLKDQFNEIRLLIQTQRAETARWILGSSVAMIGAFSVLLGLFYFFLSYAHR